MSGRKMVGFDNFVRHNPKSDKFDIRRFHHVEFWCSVSLISVIFNFEKLCVFTRMLPAVPDASCMVSVWIWWRSLIWRPVSPEDLVMYRWLKLFLTGNKKYASYAVQTGEMVLVFTAPYNVNSDTTGSSEPHVNFSHDEIRDFIAG